jgi:hypothetical protein
MFSWIVFIFSWICQHDWVAWLIGIAAICVDIVIARGLISAKKEVNSIRKRLDNIDLFKEGGFSLFTQELIAILKVNPNVVNPYTPTEAPEEGKITSETLKWALFNFVQNTYKPQ